MDTVDIVTIVGVLFVVLFGGRNVLDFALDRRRRKAALRESDLDPDSLDLDQYLDRVQLSHRRLRFGDPATSAADSRDGGADGGGISLFDIYTPLSVATEFGGAETRTTRPVQLRIPVQDAISKADAHRAVILGDPGAGKSTLVDYLVADRANTCAERRATDYGAKDADEIAGPPVHVRLSDLAPDEPGIWGAVFETHRDGQPDPVLCAQLEELLALGGQIIFDGLDEVAPEHVAAAVQTIVATGLSFQNAQLLVTCRPYDYYLAAPNRQLPTSFAKLRLLPFSIDDMLGYVDRWYNALSELEFVGNAVERKRNLQDSLRNSPALESLGGTPLLLALMALVHTTEGELPSARSVLYYRAVSHLLADSAQWRRDFVSETIRPDEVMALAQAVAFEIHSRESSSADVFVGLTVEELEAIVVEHSSLDDATTSDYVTRRRAIDARVMRMIQSNGLLVEQTTGKYNFSHRSLQEFLAGLYFLHGNDYEQAVQLAKLPTWHEPFVLMAGYGGRDGYSLFFLTKFVEELAAGPDDDVALERLLLAGEMLAEIGRETLRGKRYEALVEAPDGTEPAPLWWRIVDKLFDAHEGLPTVGEGVRLLRVLGRLGDPRFVVPGGRTVPILDRLTTLPGIEIAVGDDDEDRPPPKSLLVATSPVRRVQICELQAARYPTTNAEFAEFIEAGGYADDRWWSTEGLQWLSGDEDFAARLTETTTTWIERDFGTELQTGKFRMEDVLRDAADMSRPRLEPFYWRNARYNESNQPVVGVNWWEAHAYCAWLTHALRANGSIPESVRVGVPNEWEWERLARGIDDGRTFPWGDEEDTSSRAHTRFDGLDLDAATPVGAFPLGKSHHGLFDVGGNIWEWTASRAVPPEAAHDAGRHHAEGVVDVVVRGGSWFSDVNGAVRCGYRGIDLPQNVYYDVGFRIVVGKESTDEPT